MEKDGFSNMLKHQLFASLMSGIDVLVAARGQGPRYVLTTRNDDFILFRFQNGNCLVS